MDITLRGLIPGKIYSLQARATNGTDTSEWTPNHRFTTKTDNVAPAPVTNLLTVLTNGNMRITWTPPTTNADGTPLDDLKDFRVAIRPIPDDPSVKTKFIFTESNSVTFPKEVNQASFGRFYPELEVSVQARDILGHYSVPTVQTKNKARPSPPTSLVWKPVKSAYSASWVSPTTNTDGTPFTDLNGFEVKITWENKSVTQIVNANTFDFSVEANKAAFGGFQNIPRSPLGIQVRARDSVGQFSDPLTGVTANDPPKAVTNVTGTSVTDGIHIKWTQTDDDDLVKYEIYSAPTATGPGIFHGLVASPAAEYLHQTVAYNQDHYLWVVAVDEFDLRSVPSNRTPALRPKSPFGVDVDPPPATSLTATTANTTPDKPAGIRLTWPAVNSEDLAGYHIRYSLNVTPRVWQFTDIVDKTATEANITGLQSKGTYVFQIRSYDRSINVSAWSAEVTGVASESVVPMTNISSDIQIITGGVLRSSNYVEGTSSTTGQGWLLSPSQLNLESGRVNARVIAAGELRSNRTITSETQGSVGQPLWSLNLDGNMSINSAQVRGKIVVGWGGDSATQNSRVSIASHNYGGTGAQWAIRGDGTFDIKSGSNARVALTSAGLVGFNGVEETFNLNSSGGLYLKGVINATGGNFTGNITSEARISGGIIAGAQIFGTVYSTNEDVTQNQIRIGPNESVYGGQGPAFTFGPANAGGQRAYLRYDHVKDNLLIGNPNGVTFAGIELTTAGTIAFYHRDEFNSDSEGNRHPGMIIDSRGPRIYERLSFSTQRRQQINLFNETYGIGVQDFTQYYRTNGGFVWFKGGTHSNIQNEPGPGGVRIMRLDADGNLFVRGSITANSVKVGTDSTSTSGTLNTSDYVTVATTQTISGQKSFTGGILKGSSPVLSIFEGDSRYVLKGDAAAQQDLSGYLKTSGGNLSGALGLQDVPIRLRGTHDNNHYISHSTINDGPDIAGFGGGRLGVTSSGSFGAILTWNSNGANVNGQLTVGGSPVYTVANAPATINPSGTVVSGTGYGQSSNAGNLATYSRGDHTHGTPPAQIIVAGTGIAATASGVNYTIANSGVLSIGVTNNASVNASTGAVTITNSLTPTFTSVTTTGTVSVGTSLTVATTATVTGDIAANGGITLPSTRYISPIASGVDFRIGGSSVVADTFTRKYLTGNIVYATYGSTGAVGFAVGPRTGSSSFEIGGDHRAFFRGKAEFWDELSIHRTDGTAAFTFRPNDGANGTFSLPINSVSGEVLIDDTVLYSKLSPTTRALISAGGALAGNNLIPNSGFDDTENYLNHWSHNGTAGISSRSTTRFRYGVASLKFTGTATQAGADHYLHMRVPATPDTDYVLSAWVFVESIAAGPVGGRGVLIFDPSTGGTSAASSTLTGSHPLNVWTRHTATIRTTSTANVIEARVYAPNGVVYWDNVMLQEGVTAGPYSPKVDEILTAAIKDEYIDTVGVAKLAAGSIMTDDISLGTAGRLWTGLAGATKNSGTRLVFQGSGITADRGIFSYVGTANTVRFGADGLFALRSASTTDYINLDSSKFEMFAGGVRQVLIQAGNVDITGRITAVSGTIGGWDAANNNLSTAAGTASANWIQFSPTEGMFAGSTAFSSANFSVSTSGALKAVSGSIGGFTINGTSGLFSGGGASRVQMQPGAGFWAGADSRDSSPFYVRQDGYLRISNGQVDGTLNVNGTLSGGRISGATITGGTIQTADHGRRIVMGAANPGEILIYEGSNPASLSFYAEGTTHTGITLRTSQYRSGVSGGVLLEMRHGMFFVTGTNAEAYIGLTTQFGSNASVHGNLTVNNNLTVHGSILPAGGGSIGGSSTYGSLTINGSRNGWAGIAFSAASNNLTLMMTSNTSGVHDQSFGWRWYFSGPTGGGEWTLNAGFVPWGRITGAPATGVSSVNGRTGAVSNLAEAHNHQSQHIGNSWIGQNNVLFLRDSGDSNHMIRWDAGFDGPRLHGFNTVNVTTNWGRIAYANNGTAAWHMNAMYVGGTGPKSFVIDHPNDTKKYLVHAAVEGPTADVSYRGKAQMVDGVAHIDLPDYFESLTVPGSATAHITPIVGCDNTTCDFPWSPTMAVLPIKGRRLTVITQGGYIHSCATFYWEVKATRADIEQFEVEPNKVDYVKHGDGPYTYLTKR